MVRFGATMSGTRKMEKFEVDAYVKEREGDPHADLPARPFEPRNPDPPAPPPPATGDTRALEQVLASAAAEARAARVSLGTAAQQLSDINYDAPPPAAEEQAPPEAVVAQAAPPVTPAPPISEPVPPTPRNHGGTPMEAWEPAEAAIPLAPPPGEPAESTPDQLRTRLARKFVSLADTMSEQFNGFAIGAGAWNIELTVPAGMSTGGGKQALQHIRLVPRRQGFNVFVAGTVNQVERKAELRDFDHVAIMHEVRHRGALDISPQEWEQFLRKAEVVLNGAGIQSMRTPPPRELLEQRRSSQRVSKGAIIALVVVLVLAAVVMWRVILALRAG